jgi:hypothetical protein
MLACLHLYSDARIFRYFQVKLGVAHLAKCLQKGFYKINLEIEMSNF